MPVIRVVAEPKYLPERWERAAINFVETPAMEAFAKFLTHLRQMARGAVNAVDGTSLTLDQVALYTCTLQPGSENASGAWILLEPNEIDADFDTRESRRIAVAEHFRGSVDAYRNEHLDDPVPDMDIECHPITGTGYTIEANGVEVDRWGYPEAVVILSSVMGTRTRVYSGRNVSKIKWAKVLTFLATMASGIVEVDGREARVAAPDGFEWDSFDAQIIQEVGPGAYILHVAADQLSDIGRGT